MVRKVLLILVVMVCCENIMVFSQSADPVLAKLEKELFEIDGHRKLLYGKINRQRSYGHKEQLKSYGLPSSDYLEHIAYIFEYSEEHEQAKWIAHVIAPEVKEIGSGRTNDFRADSLVLSGTAEQTDYFNYYPEKKEGEQYDGFGYDRGHLAPSADFRWYDMALSESYYYSNISPQHPDLNRETWADMEGLLRKYVIDNNTPLAVITAPLLNDSLPKIKQSPNGVSIPKQFMKVAYDPVNKRSIAFLMNNSKLTGNPSSYALSVDELEEITGFDFFQNIDESIESSYNEKDWFSEIANGNVTPIKQNTLPTRHFNSKVAAKQANSNRTINVCGTIVGTRYSRKGHAWLNIDKKYPNQIFSIMIKKEQLVNYPFDPVTQYADQELCFEGKVEKWGDLIVMQVKKPQLVSKVTTR